MQPHTKIYMRYFGYGEQDFIPCERDLSKAVDIHHIYGRGKGKNVIENLIALCRDCHTKAHNEKISKLELLNIHLNFMKK